MSKYSLSNLEFIIKETLKEIKKHNIYANELENENILLKVEIERLNKELTIRIQNSQYLVKQKDELEEEIERLNKENNILKENSKHNDKVVDNVNWENMFLKERIDKAIKYIEENKTCFEDSLYCFDNMLEDVTPLLDILKGVDKE